MSRQIGDRADIQSVGLLFVSSPVHRHSRIRVARPCGYAASSRSHRESSASICSRARHIVALHAIGPERSGIVDRDVDLAREASASNSTLEPSPGRRSAAKPGCFEALLDQAPPAHIARRMFLHRSHSSPCGRASPGSNAANVKRNETRSLRAAVRVLLRRVTPACISASS